MRKRDSSKPGVYDNFWRNAKQSPDPKLLTGFSNQLEGRTAACTNALSKLANFRSPACKTHASQKNCDSEQHAKAGSSDNRQGRQEAGQARQEDRGNAGQCENYEGEGNDGRRNGKRGNETTTTTTTAATTTTTTHGEQDESSEEQRIGDAIDKIIRNEFNPELRISNSTDISADDRPLVDPMQAGARQGNGQASEAAAGGRRGRADSSKGKGRKEGQARVARGGSQGRASSSQEQGQDRGSNEAQARGSEQTPTTGRSDWQNQASGSHEQGRREAATRQTSRNEGAARVTHASF